jgi:hypothetical protein
MTRNVKAQPSMAVLRHYQRARSAFCELRNAVQQTTKAQECSGEVRLGDDLGRPEGLGTAE